MSEDSPRSSAWRRRSSSRSSCPRRSSLRGGVPRQRRDAPSEGAALSQASRPAAASTPAGGVVRADAAAFHFGHPAATWRPRREAPSSSQRAHRARDSHGVPGATADAGGRGAAISAPGPVALVDLIERHGGFDWREAVAVIHQICQYLKEHPPHTPILLDPRNIQITDNGEVHLLSGQTSSDPLVIQVGRLLRTMLMGKEAPPELRLLLAQATFELPIFESIEDVDRALAQLNRLDEPGPAGLALLRAVAAPPPPPNPDEVGLPAAGDSLDPAHAARSRAPDSFEATQFGSLLGGYASHVAIIFVGDRGDRRCCS